MAGDKKIKFVVRTDAIFAGGKSHPHGSVVTLTEKEAKPLLASGRVEAVK